jgi:hypothetical protein
MKLSRLTLLAVTVAWLPTFAVANVPQKAAVLRSQIALPQSLTRSQRNAANQRSVQPFEDSLRQVRQDAISDGKATNLQRTMQCTSRIVGDLVYMDCQ